jgi:hypothetical protein
LKILNMYRIDMPVHLKIIVDNISGKCKSTKLLLALIMVEFT